MKFTIEVSKFPEFEDDMYLFTLNDFILYDYDLIKIKEENEYIRVKSNKFNHQDISTDDFKKFKNDRPSMRNIDNMDNVAGSIYTHAVGNRGHFEYRMSIELISRLVEMNSRRASLSIANSIQDYYEAQVYGELDVSCLNLIHYYKDSVKLVFRASDVKNELFPDIVTIYEYFVKPIYGDNKVNLSVFSSTAQNHDSFYDVLDQLEAINEI